MEIKLTTHIKLGRPGTFFCFILFFRIKKRLQILKLIYMTSNGTELIEPAPPMSFSTIWVLFIPIKLNLSEIMHLSFINAQIFFSSF